ncbi:stage V sporulation protein B [Pseudalkalibacillus hwajinpoensis]|uniref:stage V sporulation protein B n=1 Tax=Guptibacillus hwajinpoensis TaxID=208199 RepID=UPI001CD77D4A|nr:stage V sporulation protein B [Pseudalkalibacillus hwajinpoensis]MCA0992795.1 stage V sporulation protein B [Pseudalkalibacillus hwajinpoensis]
MSKQTFLRGTLFLILAGLITKVLGFINRIVMVRVMGEEGVGLYMMAVPTLILTITLTRMGLPVAISKMVAEADAEGNRQKIKQILIVSLSITTVLSVIFTTMMIFAAPFLSKEVFTDERTFYPLVAIAPVVSIVALSSVLRGYFQGLQNMRPSAYSQVIEQIVRICLVAVLTGAFLPYGVEFAAAGAMISVVLGELASLLFMFSMFKMKKRIKIRSGFFNYLKGGRRTFNSLMKISLPTTGSQLIGSLSYFFEPIMVARSLAIAGVATTLATKQYGHLTGLAIPLLFLPTFITYSLQVSLVPAISEAHAQKQYKQIQHRLSQAIRLSMVAGGLSVVVTYIFAVPLMDIMYNAPHVAIYVQVMAPFFFFYYFQGPLAAALQALDLAKAAMINSFIGAGVKLIAIFFLASRPELGIMGAALAIVIGILLVTLLHFATLVKAIGFSLVVSDLLKGVTSIIATGFAGHFLYHSFSSSSTDLFGTVLAISVTSIIYLVILLLLGLINRHDLRRMPFIGKFIH